MDYGIFNELSKCCRGADSQRAIFRLCYSPQLCQIVDINNMAIAVIVMVKLYQYVSATGKQFGLRIVSQQGDGRFLLAAAFRVLAGGVLEGGGLDDKGGCAMVRSKIKHDVILKSILPDGILHIIVLALAAVY